MAAFVCEEDCSEMTSSQESFDTSACQETTLPSLQEDNLTSTQEADSTQYEAYVPRKNKSLYLLCLRFLSHYPLECRERRRIQATEIGQLIGAHKRRVYDIINILEGLNFITKVDSRVHIWEGDANLESVMSELGVQCRLDPSIQKIVSSYGIPKWRKVYLKNSDEDKEQTEEEICVGDVPFTNDLEKCEPNASFLEGSEVNTVGKLARMLIMLLLALPEDLSTKKRRLYDVANVLKATGILNRVVIDVGGALVGGYRLAPFPSKTKDLLAQTKSLSTPHGRKLNPPSVSLENKENLSHLLPLDFSQRSSDGRQKPMAPFVQKQVTYGGSSDTTTDSIAKAQKRPAPLPSTALDVHSYSKFLPDMKDLDGNTTTMFYPPVRRVAQKPRTELEIKFPHLSSLLSTGRPHGAQELRQRIKEVEDAGSNFPVLFRPPLCLMQPECLLLAPSAE
ncbi:unnamed protein product [Cyprideis torosa]|uniref:Uncharacterized protein n=1 Tax=Cyprideis torosa TaxID=163714 RepID=A0A7R8ZTB1_9CRUS|nr:unnamed protein product [Cyprideis torosa]CAG0897799.1 unnamed protein product [Cyprideis torosa]